MTNDQKDEENGSERVSNIDSHESNMESIIDSLNEPSIREKPISPLSERPSLGSLWYSLTIFFFWVLLSFYSWNQLQGAGWASRATVFDQGEWWRLFTSLFVHSDIAHLLGNAPLFIIFGCYLNFFFGIVTFPIASLLVGMGSMALTLLFYQENTKLIGASGMLYGMVGQWLVLYVRFETVYTLREKIFRALGSGVLLLFPTTFHPTTSYSAHFWGFLLGVLSGIILIPTVKKLPIAALIEKER